MILASIFRSTYRYRWAYEPDVNIETKIDAQERGYQVRNKCGQQVAKAVTSARLDVRHI